MLSHSSVTLTYAITASDWKKNLNKRGKKSQVLSSSHQLSIPEYSVKEVHSVAVLVLHEREKSVLALSAYKGGEKKVLEWVYGKKLKKNQPYFTHT